MLAGLSPYLSEPLKEEALREALAAARKIEGEWSRSQALAGLSPYLSEPLKEEALREALAAARKIKYEPSRAKALAELVPRLAELGYPDKALAAAREIRDADDRAQALAGLAPHLPEPLLGEALAAARWIRDKESRAQVLAGLEPHVAQLPSQQLYPAWQETLSVLAIRSTRRDLVSDLRALAPVIAALGGEEAVAETFRAIQDVGRWWP